MNFNERCYKILKRVPRGKVTTYMALAKALRSKAYRAVGNAMNKNPYPGAGKNQAPCHRVVCSDGRTGGFASGPKRKIAMLKKEGIKIINGKIDLKKYLYRFK